MRALLVLALLASVVLATAAAASARVVDRGRTRAVFGIASVDGKLRRGENRISMRVTSHPRQFVLATLDVVCVRTRDFKVRYAKKVVRRRMSPFTLTVRRPRLRGSGCSAGGDARLAHIAAPLNFRWQLFARLNAR
jgi:hypothetical protein